MSATATRRRASRPPARDVEAKVAAMLGVAKASGLKLTPQRLAIVRELASDPTHPTAQELFERLRPALPTMSFATVYNTLDALAGAGLCAAISLAPGATRFDPNMDAHHHAICDGCGEVRDVPCHDAASAEPTASHDPAGFRVRAVEIVYRGLCARCARGAAHAPT
jgi:Fur family peroxide stress response transcriptional regulator